MELTVYRQSSKQRPDGRIIYKGEDARPFVGKNVLFVADGLGGASAIRHQKFKTELFDKEQILSVLFEGLSEYDQETLSKGEKYNSYVINSFEEFTSIKDCYFDNIYNIKKSGYFASRIVAAIFLHEVLFDQYRPEPILSIGDGKLFDLYNATENKEAFLKKIGDYFTERIRGELKKIAQNANLIYESSYSGLALLGTTLCGTIFFERDSYVEAFYLVAGDSRPYVWTQDGLRQVVEDQEGKDGGMTNYIKANEDGVFSIECKYVRINKPCMLFNASDGCFDSKYFISQMAFEKLILETIVEKNDLDSVAKSLEETFLEYGKHDDSSTIAMKFFGYEDYEAIKAVAAMRLSEIERKYLADFPELLSEDYAAKLEEFKNSCPESLKQFKSELGKIPSVVGYCREAIKNGKSAAYTARSASLDSRVNTEKQKYAAEVERFRSIVERNYLYLVKHLNWTNSYREKDLDRIADCREAYYKLIEEYKRDVEVFKNGINSISEVLLEEIAKLEAVDISAEGDFEGLDLGKIFACKNKVSEMESFFKGLKTGKNETIKRLKLCQREYFERNSKCARGQKQEIDGICQQLFDGKIDLTEVELFDAEKALLTQSINTLRAIRTQIRKIDVEERDALIAEIYPNFWEENYLSVMKNILENHVPEVDAETEAQIREYINLFERELSALENNFKKQQARFEEYDEKYYSMIRSVQA